MRFYCTNCDNKKALKSKKIRKKFDISGLDYITIDGVAHFHCEKCGEDYFNYGNLEEIHEAIAKHVATKSEKLTGNEIRFLRTYLGYSSGKFAEDYLKITPSAFSRIENGTDVQSESLDQLIRTLALTKTPDRDYDIHDLLVSRHPRRNVLLRLPSMTFEPLRA